MRRNRKICAECPYYKEKGKAPIGLENNGSKVLLLFQAPGKDEWDGKTYNSRRIPVASKNKSYQSSILDVINVCDTANNVLSLCDETDCW